MTASAPATVRDTAAEIAERHSVSVSLVNAIADRVMPIEKGKRAGQWQLAEQAHELQAEKVRKWAEVFGDLVDLEPRTLYEYAATWETFGHLSVEMRCKYRFSVWQVVTRYTGCQGWFDVFQSWRKGSKTPRVAVLRAELSAKFGNEPTPQAARAKVSRLYKSLTALQVDVYNTVPIAAKAELAVAFAAVGRAVKIMEAENGNV